MIDGFVYGVGLTVTILGVLFGVFLLGRFAASLLGRRATYRRTDLWLSPSEACSKYHVQRRSCCEDLACGDNTSPARDLVRQSLDVYLVLQAGNPVAWFTLLRLGEAIEKCGVKLSSSEAARLEEEKP